MSVWTSVDLSLFAGSKSQIAASYPLPASPTILSGIEEAGVY